MRNIAILSVAVVLFAGCSNIDLTRSTRLIASVEPATKTSLSGLTVSWTSGDKMAIVDNTGAHLFTADATGRRVPISSTAELASTGKYYGFYPYDLFTSVSNGTFTGTLKTNQFLAAGQQWDPEGPILVGSCDAGAQEIPFVNAHALLEFTLAGPASSITVDTHHHVSGNFTAVLNANNTIASITPATEHVSDFVALVANSGMVADTPYYIAALPKEEAADVTVLVRYTAAGNSTLGQCGVTKSGLWYYNLYLPPITSGEKVSVAFVGNQISAFDLRQATPVWLDGPLSDFKTAGSYLFVGPDGNAIWLKDKGGNDMKFQNLHADIYTSDTGTASDLLIVDSYVNGGTHSMSFDLSHYDQDQTVKILIYCPIDQNGTHLPGNGNDHHYYLAYATKHPGSFCLVNTVEEATSFEGYRFQ